MIGPMRRALPFALLLGCSDPGVLEHFLAMEGTYRDVRISDQPDDLHVLRGTILERLNYQNEAVDQFDTEDPISDLADVDERDLQRGPRVLVNAEDGLYLVETTRADRILSAEDTKIYGARTRNGGILTLEDHPEDGCSLRWYDGVQTLEAAVSLPDEACLDTATIHVDRDSADAFVVTPTRTWAATPGYDPLTWEGGGDLSAFDPAHRIVAVATRGETETRAWDLFGSEAFFTDLGQAITDMDDLGVAGTFVYGTSPGANGRLVLMSSLDGTVLHAEELPRAPVRVRGAEVGTPILVGLQAELHLFEYTPSGTL
jgi:hypothetical protein